MEYFSKQFDDIDELVEFSNRFIDDVKLISFVRIAGLITSVFLTNREDVDVYDLLLY